MQFTPYVLPTLLSALILVGLALYAWSFRSVPGATPFAIGSLLGAAWALDYALAILSGDLETRILWTSLRYPILGSLCVAWFIMVAQYTGRTRALRGRRLAALGLVPAVTTVLSLTSTQHTLFRYNFRTDTAGPLPALMSDAGPWYLVHALYSDALVVVGVLLMARSLDPLRQLYSRQVLTVVLGLLLPWTVNILFDLGITPVHGFNLGPSSASISGLLIAWGILRFHFFQIVPVARSLVVENMSDLMLVLDARNRLVDFNPAAQKALGLDPVGAIGRAAESIFAGWPELLARYRDVPETRETIRTGADRPVYDLTITPIKDERGQHVGRMVLLHEVTELERAKEAAQAATRAKSAFLTNMSHDIRTPLNSVLGFVQLLDHDQNLTPVQKDYLAHVRRGGEHLLELLNSILEVSRIEAGKMAPDSSPFGPRDLVAGERVLCLRAGQPVRRVLVVDDDLANRELLVAFLESFNPPAGAEPVLEVRDAVDGQQAVEVWESWQPHLILMDMLMPMLGGREATQEIKARLRTRPDALPTAIIAVSASVFDEDRVAYLACGCDGFASKPVEEEQLIDLLATHLGLSFLPEEDAGAPLPAGLTFDELERRVAECPAAWVADLGHAVDLGDFQRVAELIEEISSHDAELAAHLAKWARDYDQGALLRLLGRHQEI